MKKIVLAILLLCFTMTTFAQVKTVTGKVTDENGTPLAQVSIFQKNTQNGAVTNAEGVFKLNVKDGSTLLISAMGFENVEIKANKSSPFNIILKTSYSNLSEVVVTALGINKTKKAINYSAQTVNSENIANSGRSNLIDGINGKIAGVQITNAGGQAGAASSIVIRGYNSLTGNNEPLYVVDGIPIDNTSDRGSSGSQGIPISNRAIDLNPNDIESLTVLKGGAATALYGIQAANGALIITTKKGRAGKINIEAGYTWSTASVNKFSDYSTGFLRGGAGAGLPGGGVYTTPTTNNWGPLAADNPVFPANTKLDLTGTGVAVDVSGQKIPFFDRNYHNFFVTGTTNKYDIAISGGGDKTTFYAAISKLDQGSVVRNNTYDKTSAVINITNQLTSRLKIEAKVNYINTGGLRFNSSRLMSSLGYYVNTWDIVNYPWKDPSGQETWWQKSISSPMWTVHETGENYRLNRYLANISGDYLISKDFSLLYRFGIDNYAEDRRNVDPIGTLGYAATGFLGEMHEIHANSFQSNSDLILSYKHQFGNISVQALAGHNIFYKKYDMLDITGSSFVLPQLFDITNTQSQTIFHNSYRKKTIGIYTNAQIAYKDYLFLETALRNDWSSTLPRNNNNFMYPSVSLGFVFSNFIKTTWLSYGKLRASYAATANDAPVNSLATAYKNITPSVFGNTRFSYPQTVGNPDIRPEFTRQREIGFDLGFLRQKINLEFTYYAKRSFDQIIYAPTGYTTGVTSQLINLGETTNKGIDATLTFKDIVKVSGVSWTSAFNFSRNVGKVIKVGENGNDKVTLLNAGNGAGFSTAEVVAQKGQAFGAIYGYAWERYGVDVSDPGYVEAPMLLDASGVPTISSSKVLLGNINPDFILGWNNVLHYKGLGFGFTLEWKKGGDVINDQNSFLVYSGKSAITQQRFYASTVTGANATKTYSGVDATGRPATGTPIQLTKGYYTGTYIAQDETFVEDASWLRLRNIYVSYSLPKSIASSLHLTGIDFTIGGRNVFLQTKYTGIDPEVSAAGTGSNRVIGMDSNGVPSAKSWDVSIRVKF